MRLSLSWIFDHIDVDWQKQNVEKIVEKFNQITAEIDEFYPVEFDLTNFALGKVTKINQKTFIVSIPEWKKEVELPAQEISIYCLPEQKDLFFILSRTGDKIKFATVQDFGVEKEGILPPVAATDKDLDGSWRVRFETKDIIFDVDNKSITHRPDMWCHRGFAREIAAYMNLPFIEEEKFINKKEVAVFDKKTDSTDQNPISIEIKNPEACKRFAGIYFSSIENKPTDIFVLSRLLKVGARPINAIVDITNYLMFDWSQPTHAYDADNIRGKKIIARFAKKKEKLTLLDESELELTDQDLVISDAKQPLCLGGVMGGKDDSVTSKTRSLFLESANFVATPVRRTSMRYGARTESSSRFEKTLDSNQTIVAIERFLNLLDQFNVKYKCADKVVCAGQSAKVVTIDIEHSFLERRAGFNLKESDIVDPLTRLGFTIKLNGTSYHITVPTFRSSKDIEIKEDILEEVIRFYGFDRVKLNLPSFKRQAYDLTPRMLIRKIKNYFVNVAKMTEQNNYIFYDEQFIKLLNYDIGSDFWEISNPASENQKCLATSLIPNLLKNIQENVAENESLYFFEVARIWTPNKIDERGEHKKLSGIFFEKRKDVDFYECKSHITGFLNIIGIFPEQISFIKVDEPKEPWFMPYQTANVLIDGKVIGIIGKADKTFLSKLNVLPESDAFIFDFDFDYILEFVSKFKKYEILPKYQETYIDLSVLVPINSTVDNLQKKLNSIDQLIKHVSLVDFFEKEDWLDKRSLTFRLVISDAEKTLEKDQIDSVSSKCVAMLEKEGAKLRSS